MGETMKLVEQLRAYAQHPQLAHFSDDLRQAAEALSSTGGVTREEVARIIDPEAWEEYLLEDGRVDQEVASIFQDAYEESLAKADQILALLEKGSSHSHPVIAGDAEPSAEWVLVPREPTEAMIDAYFDKARALGFVAHMNASCMWETMISASPPPPSSEGGGWRPIETAPADGTLLLLTDIEGDMPLVGAWCADRRAFVCARDDDRFYPQPTHWRPLPPPPANPAEGA